MTRTRTRYDGVAVVAPVTIPYVRYSDRDAQWFLARTLAALLKSSGLKKDQIDGLGVSSFTLFPDTAVGLTQHLGFSPRWLDHLPFGGASGVTEADLTRDYRSQLDPRLNYEQAMELALSLAHLMARDHE